MLRESGALPRTPRGPSAPRPHLRTQAVNCPLKRGSSNRGGIEAPSKAGWRDSRRNRSEEDRDPAGGDPAPSSGGGSRLPFEH